MLYTLGRGLHAHNSVGAPGTPTFDPYSLAPFAVYDFSDTDSITDSSDIVTGVGDQSVNDRDIIVTYGDPKTNTRTINELNAIEFNGDDSLDLISDFNDLANGANTFFMVTASDTAASGGSGGYRTVRGRVGSGTRWGGILNRNSTNSYETINNSGFSPLTHTPDPVFDTGIHVTGIKFDGSTELISLYDGSVETGTGAVNSSIDSVDIGAIFAGSIGEAWFFDKELTDAEVYQIGDWLAEKWGTIWRRNVNIVWHGDSRTDGSGGIGDKMHTRAEPLLSYIALTQTEYADGGEKITNEAANYLGHIQASYDATADVNISVISGFGINDCRLDAVNPASAITTGQAIIDAWTNMCTDAHSEGYVVQVSTIPWRTSNDTNQETARNMANDWLRSSWASIADDFYDLAAENALGNDGVFSATYLDNYVDVSHFDDTGQDAWAGFLATGIQALMRK